MQGGKRRSKVGTNGISALFSACNDINDISYTIAITHARIVYEVNLRDVLRIESQHLRLVHNDAIYSDLNAAAVVDSCNGVVDIVDTQIGKREFLKNAVAVVR